MHQEVKGGFTELLFKGRLKANIGLRTCYLSLPSASVCWTRGNKSNRPADSNNLARRLTLVRESESFSIIREKSWYGFVINWSFPLGMLPWTKNFIFSRSSIVSWFEMDIRFILNAANDVGRDMSIVDWVCNVTYSWVAWIQGIQIRYPVSYKKSHTELQ